MTVAQPRTTHEHSLEYRPDIDGLRAIAVLAVIAFHFFPTRLRGGALGVDIFFVISGYLISSIILRWRQESRFSFVQFYARRIKRIFPALIVVLSSCLVAGWVILSASEFRRLGKHAAAGTGFIYNLFAWGEAGSFAALSNPLGHLWSLGVEEQFYLVWPVVLVLAYRRRAWLPRVIGALLLASLALHVVLIDRREAMAFFFPVTRLWELATGSLLACVAGVVDPIFAGLSRAWRELLAWASLGGIALSTAILDIRRILPEPLSSHLPPTTILIAPVLCTFVLIATGPETWVHRHLLAHRVAVSIGIISYPLYLWHLPLLSFAYTVGSGLPSFGVRIVLIGATFVVAWITYALIEVPIRFRGRTGPRAIALASTMSVVGFVGLLIAFGHIPNH